MRPNVWLFTLSIVISCLVVTEQGGLAHLSGTVVSEDGAPVGGVKIFAWHEAMTDAEGSFDLSNIPNKDSVLYFQKEGFRPKAMVVKTGATTVKVILEDDSKTAWFLPACEPKDSKASPTGYGLKYSLPKKLQVRKIKDIDYQEYLVGVASGTAPLQLWWGGLVSPGKTVDDLILRSMSFEERSIRRKSGETVGYNRRGRTADGMAWRSADFPGLSGTALYEDVSREVATTYDQIVDSACQLVQAR